MFAFFIYLDSVVSSTNKVGKLVAADIIQKINSQLIFQGIDLSLNVDSVTGKSKFISTSSKTIHFNLDGSFNCDNSSNKIFKSLFMILISS